MYVRLPSPPASVTLIEFLTSESNSDRVIPTLSIDFGRLVRKSKSEFCLDRTYDESTIPNAIALSVIWKLALTIAIAASESGYVKKLIGTESVVESAGAEALVTETVKVSTNLVNILFCKLSRFLASTVCIVTLTDCPWFGDIVIP